MSKKKQEKNIYLQDLLQINKEKKSNNPTEMGKDHRIVTEKETEMAFQHMKDAQPNS